MRQLILHGTWWALVCAWVLKKSRNSGSHARARRTDVLWNSAAHWKGAPCSDSARAAGAGAGAGVSRDSVHRGTAGTHGIACSGSCDDGPGRGGAGRAACQRCGRAQHALMRDGLTAWHRRGRPCTRTRGGHRGTGPCSRRGTCRPRSPTRTAACAGTPPRPPRLGCSAPDAAPSPSRGRGRGRGLAKSSCPAFDLAPALALALVLGLGLALPLDLGRDRE